jgi:hypothetical protein
MNEIVTQENGPCPAGKPDECFYCRQKIGAPHKFECVIPQRYVVVRETIERVVAVPKSWNVGEIHFKYNEGSWCADNIVRDLQKLIDKALEGECTLCPIYRAEYVREATEGDLAQNRISGTGSESVRE